MPYNTNDTISKEFLTTLESICIKKVKMARSQIKSRFHAAGEHVPLHRKVTSKKIKFGATHQFGIPKPPVKKYEGSLQVSSTAKIELNVYIPNNSLLAMLQRPTLVWVPGCAFEAGVTDGTETLAMHFAAELNCQVIVVNPRTQVVTPEPQNDFINTLNYFLKHPEEFNIDLSKLSVGGYSSGGYLVLHALFENFELANKYIRAVILCAPLLSFDSSHLEYDPQIHALSPENLEAMAKHFLPQDTNDNTKASMLDKHEYDLLCRIQKYFESEFFANITKKIAKLPIILMTGEQDYLLPQSIFLHQMLCAHGLNSTIFTLNNKEKCFNHFALWLNPCKLPYRKIITIVDQASNFKAAEKDSSENIILFKPIVLSYQLKNLLEIIHKNFSASNRRSMRLFTLRKLLISTIKKIEMSVHAHIVEELVCTIDVDGGKYTLLSAISQLGMIEELNALLELVPLEHWEQHQVLHQTFPALSIAVEYKQYEVIHNLIALGANTTCRYYHEDGWILTPIREAVLVGDIELIQLLLDHNAGECLEDIVDAFDTSCLLLLADEKSEENIRANKNDMIKKLLLAFMRETQSINKQENSHTTKAHSEPSKLDLKILQLLAITYCSNKIEKEIHSDFDNIIEKLFHNEATITPQSFSRIIKPYIINKYKTEYINALLNNKAQRADALLKTALKKELNNALENTKDLVLLSIAIEGNTETVAWLLNKYDDYSNTLLHTVSRYATICQHNEVSDLINAYLLGRISAAANSLQKAGTHHLNFNMLLEMSNNLQACLTPPPPSDTSPSSDQSTSYTCG